MTFWRNQVSNNPDLHYYSTRHNYQCVPNFRIDKNITSLMEWLIMFNKLPLYIYIYICMYIYIYNFKLFLFTFYHFISYDIYFNITNITYFSLYAVFLLVSIAFSWYVLQIIIDWLYWLIVSRSLTVTKILLNVFL